METMSRLEEKRRFAELAGDDLVVNGEHAFADSCQALLVDRTLQRECRCQGESGFSSWLLFPDGWFVVTQDNGQVCFLQLYEGNRKIGIKKIPTDYSRSHNDI